MASKHLFVRARRLTSSSARLFSISARSFGFNERAQDTAQEWRKHQTEKPLNHHITNTTSTIANEMPSIGKDSPPPEMISSVDANFVPTDSVPENTDKLTGGTQSSGSAAGSKKELDVGELEGASFKVEPKRRSGEDLNTLRARLLYQSRKRGTLESDLLLSTFADANLGNMTHDQLLLYDIFLDENDWDIYYWATQEPPSTSAESTDNGKADISATENQQSRTETDAWRQANPRPGEWAQTVGTFKPAYRPVPNRWKNSEVLAMLRKHVKDRSAGGVHEAQPSVQGRSLGQHMEGTGGGGLGRMPVVRNFDT